MCGCKNCKGITLLKGNGIVSTVDNNDGTFTITYSDGSTFTTSDLTGPQGIQGIQGPAGANGTNGTNGTNGVSTYNLIHSEYPHDTTVTTGTLEQLGDPAGYALADWDIAPVGIAYEMEFDLFTSGGPEITNNLIAFYLNGSNTYIPALVFGDPILPLLEDEYQTLNVKITLTKIDATTGFVSLIAHRIPGGTSGTPVLVFGMSKTIVLAGGVVDAVEVIAKVTTNPVTLERVIIKEVIPA
jgi:hypothetical protein